MSHKQVNVAYRIVKATEAMRSQKQLQQHYCHNQSYIDLSSRASTSSNYHISENCQAFPSPPFPLPCLADFYRFNEQLSVISNKCKRLNSIAGFLMLPILEPHMIEAIARALGDTEEGLTGAEIDRLLTVCGIIDEHGPGTKWRRLNHNFWNQQVKERSSAKIETFLIQAMSPSRHLVNQDKYEVMRENLNKALAFIGMCVDSSGTICLTKGKAKTISDAEQRARNLKEDLQLRNIHPRVLYYCRAELVADDYFHAAHEAVKGVFDRLRDLSGLRYDGHKLIDSTLLRDEEELPILIINNYQKDSERSEQNGAPPPILWTTDRSF
jgi:hypothetical protein